VTSVEIVPELSASAKHKLRSSHCDNVTLEVGMARRDGAPAMTR